MLAQEKGWLREAIYSFLDGWSDEWSLTPNKQYVKIRVEYVTRKLASPEMVDMIRQVMLNVLPFLGETQLYPFYRKQLTDEFGIDEY